MSHNSKGETGKTPKQKRTFKLVSKRVHGLYKDSLTGTYYGRLGMDGKRNKTKLMATDDAGAKLEFEGWRVELKKSISDQKAASPETGKCRSFGDYAKLVLKSEDCRTDVKEKSIVYVHERWAGLKKNWPKLETTPIKEITSEDLESWAKKFSTDFYGHTYNRTLAFVKAVFQRAVDAGRILRNPASKLKSVGVKPGKRDVPTIPGFRSILTQMRSRKFGRCKRAADLAALLCFTASRLSEGTAICWKDVDWVEEEVTITRCKVRKRSNEPAKTVKFPFWSELENLLKRMKEASPNAQPNDRISLVKDCRGTMQNAVKELQDAKKLPNEIHLHHHALRHCWASWAVQSGMDIKTIAYLLGHSDGGVLVLKTYAHLLPGQAAGAIVKLEKLTGTNSGG